MFQDEDGCAKQLKLQATDLAVMSPDMTRRIVNNTAELNNNSADCPRSSIMGITADPSDFAAQKVLYISDHVAEIVAQKHMKDVWNEISAAENSPSRGLLFEAFLRSLMKGDAQEFSTRNACGKSSKDYKDLFKVDLGGCVDIERTDNMIKSCKTGRERVIYYSYTSQRHWLILCIRLASTIMLFKLPFAKTAIVMRICSKSSSKSSPSKKTRNLPWSILSQTEFLSALLPNR